MFRISEELEAMPELERIRRIHVQQLNFFIFQRNTEELRELLRFHSDVKENFDILWHEENREKQYALQREIGRLLHNFTVAAMSLVDVTRRLYKRYGSELFPDYQARLDTDFVTDSLSRFVKDLRNYVAHYEAPPIVSVLNFSFGEEQSLESQIALPTQTLLKYTDWSKPAKEYIARCGDKVVLDLAVSEYFEKVNQFYNWFYERLNEIHSEDISRITEKQEELKRAYTPHPADLISWEDYGQ